MLTGMMSLPEAGQKIIPTISETFAVQPAREAARGMSGQQSWSGSGQYNGSMERWVGNKSEKQKCG
jgi:hypothetical protein